MKSVRANRKHFLFLALSAAALLPSLSARAEQAAQEVKLSKALISTITKSLESSHEKLKVESISKSPMPGVYQVSLEGEGVLYTDKTGQFFVVGDLYQAQPNNLINLTQQAREDAQAAFNPKRKAMLAQVPDSEAVVYKAVGTKKASVTVFTDVDCGYCRKLHLEVPRLNELGIEVKYLAFPRAGLGSPERPTPSYSKIASAWCAKDPASALTMVKQGKKIETNICADNPISRHLALGSKIGVQGTPALVTEDGKLLPGYMPAAELAKVLGVEPKS